MIKSIDKFGLNILNGWKIQLVKDGKNLLLHRHIILYLNQKI